MPLRSRGRWAWWGCCVSRPYWSQTHGRIGAEIVDALTVGAIAAAATIGSFVVAWLALGAQRRRDHADRAEADRRRDEAIMAELRGVREGQVRLETLWGERDRSARDRRRDWIREATEAARAAARDLVCEHASGCPARSGGGGTNPRIHLYQGPISGDSP